MKMRQYGLSEARVRRILHTPGRIEEGIAPKTIAVMQTVKSPTRTYELWVMIVEERNRRRIISTWKYPGQTKPGAPIVFNFLEEEYAAYKERREDRKEQVREKLVKSKWFRAKPKPVRTPANLLIVKSKAK